MAKTLEGDVLFAEFEAGDSFDWTDPATGKTKTLRSIKVLKSNGDRTVTRESLSVPDGVSPPRLEPGKKYGFPVKINARKKDNKINYTLRGDIPPLDAPEIS